MTWNPHKSMGVPHQCSCFVTKHQHMLAECNSTEAGYLFQKDTKTYDSSLDTGDKSIQCGRLADVFKLWLMWKHEVRMHNYGSYNFLFRCRRCYCLSYPCVTFVACKGVWHPRHTHACTSFHFPRNDTQKNCLYYCRQKTYHRSINRGCWVWRRE